MKYVIFSFDDGRKDTYDVAYKLLKQYECTASIHVTTGLIDGSIKKVVNNPFQNIEGMSINDIVEMSNDGFDISSHSDMHTNEETDLKISLTKLINWGLLRDDYLLFSSPYSEIYKGNFSLYSNMLERNNIRYLRSGNQLRRSGILYCILFVIQMILKSKILFYILNKKNIMTTNDICTNETSNVVIIKATAVRYWNTIKQLRYFLNKLKNETVVVFLFHSIMYEKDIVTKNNWTFTAEKFEELLKILKAEEGCIKIVNIRDLLLANKPK
jgi:hypothetical protein